jgi:hypothetical protein
MDNPFPENDSRPLLSAARMKFERLTQRGVLDRMHRFEYQNG